MAGVVGIDFRPFTWNELHHMFMGHQRFNWERTSLLTTMLVNVNATKKDRITDTNSFNPYSLTTSAIEAEELLAMQERGEVKSNFSLSDLFEEI